MKTLFSVGGKLHQGALGGVFCPRVFIFKTCYCLVHGSCFLSSVFIKSSNQLLLFGPGASNSAHQNLLPTAKKQARFLKELAGAPNFRGQIVFLFLGHSPASELFLTIESKTPG